MNFLSDQMPEADVEALRGLCIDTKVRVAANVGTFTGKSALVLAEYAERVYAIDTFRGSGPGKNEMTDAYRTADVFAQLMRNLKESEHGQRVTVWTAESVEAARTIAEPLDMVFIDADHRYSQVRADIEAWRPKVRTGGILCGHDFDAFPSECDPRRMMKFCEQDFVDRRHYGVIRAVGEAFPDARKAGGSVWWVRV